MPRQRRRKGGGGGGQGRQEVAQRNGRLPTPIEYELRYVVRCDHAQASQGALQKWGFDVLQGKKFRGAPVRLVGGVDDEEEEEDEDVEEEEEEEEVEPTPEPEPEPEPEEEEEEEDFGGGGRRARRRRRRRQGQGADNQGGQSQPQSQQSQGQGKRRRKQKQQQQEEQPGDDGAWTKSGNRKKMKKQMHRDAKQKQREQAQLREKTKQARVETQTKRWGTEKCTRALFLSGLAESAADLEPRELQLELEKVMVEAVVQEGDYQAQDRGTKTAQGKRLLRAVEEAEAPLVVIQEKKTSGKGVGKVYAVALFKTVLAAQLVFDATRRGLQHRGKAIWAKFTDEQSARPRRPPGGPGGPPGGAP